MASRKVLLGMVPERRVMPPRVSCRSRIATLAPNSHAWMAAVKPAGPLPITMTS